MLEVDDIKPNKEYTMTDFHTLGIFAWAKDYRTLKKTFAHDLGGENLLQIRVEGKDRQARYWVKGSNIIRYIKKYGAMMSIAIRKPKQQCKKTKNAVRTRS